MLSVKKSSSGSLILEIKFLLRKKRIYIPVTPKALNGDLKSHQFFPMLTIKIKQKPVKTTNQTATKTGGMVEADNTLNKN